MDRCHWIQNSLEKNQAEGKLQTIFYQIRWIPIFGDLVEIVGFFWVY